MTPYYEDDAVTIYHSDAMTCSWPFSFSALITDPPYGTGHYATDNVVDVARLLDGLQPAAVFGWPERLVQLAIDINRAPDEWVTWWPTNAAAKSPMLASSKLPHECECIAVFGAGEWARTRRVRSTAKFTYDMGRASLNNLAGLERQPLSIDAKLGDVWTDASPGVGFNYGDRLHPNEKPLSVMARLVEALTEPGDTVFDPFMGSGTTLRAAKDLGRKAVGIEIEERYCEIAAKRMAQEVLAL